MTTRSHYTPCFIAHVLLTLEDEGLAVEAVAERYGLEPDEVRTWARVEGLLDDPHRFDHVKDKNIEDVPPETLAEMASVGSRRARREALARGRKVTMFKDGRYVWLYPSGKTEPLNASIDASGLK